MGARISVSRGQLSLRMALCCQVAEALEDSGIRERAPVGVLKKQLMSLQADVAAAHERLHTTEVTACSTLRSWPCCVSSFIGGGQ